MERDLREVVDSSEKLPICKDSTFKRSTLISNGLKTSLATVGFLFSVDALAVNQEGVKRGSSEDLQLRETVTVENHIFPAIHSDQPVSYNEIAQGGYFSEDVYYDGNFHNDITREDFGLNDLSGLPLSNGVYPLLIASYPYSIIRVDRADQSLQNVFLVNFANKSAKNISSVFNSSSFGLSPLYFLSDDKVLIEDSSQRRYVFDRSAETVSFIGQNAMESNVSKYKSDLNTAVGGDLVYDNMPIISKSGIYRSYIVGTTGSDTFDTKTVKVYFDPEVEVQQPAEVSFDFGGADAIKLSESTSNKRFAFSVNNFPVGATLEAEMGSEDLNVVVDDQGEAYIDFSSYNGDYVGKITLYVYSVDDQLLATSSIDADLNMELPPVGEVLIQPGDFNEDMGYLLTIPEGEEKGTFKFTITAKEGTKDRRYDKVLISVNVPRATDFKMENGTSMDQFKILSSDSIQFEISKDDFGQLGDAFRFSAELPVVDNGSVMVQFMDGEQASVVEPYFFKVQNNVGEDMGPVETDMGGDMNSPDMTDPGKADQGGTPDLGTPSKPTSGSEDGSTCNVVNPTAPMHKTPGGLTLLFASALTVAAGFRKKGKKSE